MRNLLCLCVLALLFGQFDTEVAYHIQVEEPPSEIEGREDLMGRLDYMRMLTADPQTGEIPANIAFAEIAFANQQLLRFRGSRTEQLEITSLGPTNVGGRTRAVAFDVRNEQTILAGGVSGGVWKSLDGGTTWTRKSDPQNRNTVTCIVQDVRPGREDTWYHGTGELQGNSARGGNAPFRGNGIYKSTDNGESWFPIASTQVSDPGVFNSQFQYIWDLEVNPQNLEQDELFVAAYGGILRSADGGETWDVTLGQKLFDLPDTADINTTSVSSFTSIERSASNVFYATLSTIGPFRRRSVDDGIYYSIDGISWNNITPLTEESVYQRVVIGSSPSDPNITYFMVDSNPILILEHDLSLLTSPSRINGFDPEPRKLPPFEEEISKLNTQGSYNMTIRVHPEDPQTVFVGGTNLYRSTDAFRTEENISWIGGYDTDGSVAIYPNHHPDQHDLLFLPSNSNVALSANDGGVHLSSDILKDTVVWEDKNDGYITSQFFTIAQSQDVDSDILVGGMQDNGSYLSTALPVWKSVLGGDGGYAATTMNDKLWFLSFQRGQTLRVTLNDDFEISSFARVDPGSLLAQLGGQYLFINPFVLDPKNENRMFAAGGNHLFYHPNVSQIPGGSQIPTALGWQRLTADSAVSSAVSAVAISYDGEVLYFGSSLSGLFRLNGANRQQDFQLEDITSAAFPLNSYVSCIAINPADNQHVVVVFSNYNVRSVFESTDGGVTFSDISGSLEEQADGTGAGPSVRWAEIIPEESGYQVVVGTSVGLYAAENTADGDPIWIKQSPQLIGNAVVTMMDYRPEDGRLVIATHGNGVFETFIPDFKPVIDDELPDLAGFQLLAAYPNPFRESTQIQFSIPESGDVRVDVFTTSGELINTILWGPQFAGENSVTWNGDTPSGFPLANGAYLYRVSYQGQSLTGRLLLKR